MQNSNKKTKNSNAQQVEPQRMERMTKEQYDGLKKNRDTIVKMIAQQRKQYLNNIANNNK